MFNGGVSDGRRAQSSGDVVSEKRHDCVTAARLKTGGKVSLGHVVTSPALNLSRAFPTHVTTTLPYFLVCYVSMREF